MNDSIWFTFKARIRASQRLADTDFHSQILLVWYAFVGTLLSIVTIRHDKVLPTTVQSGKEMKTSRLLAFSIPAVAVYRD